MQTVQYPSCLELKQGKPVLMRCQLIGVPSLPVHVHYSSLQQRQRHHKSNNHAEFVSATWDVPPQLHQCNEVSNGSTLNSAPQYTSTDRGLHSANRLFATGTSTATGVRSRPRAIMPSNSLFTVLWSASITANGSPACRKAQSSPHMMPECHDSFSHANAGHLETGRDLSLDTGRYWRAERAVTF